MVIDKICKMTVKGVKLKSESFFLISPGVLEFSLENFIGLGCLDQILQGGEGWKTPPQTYTLSKSPVLIRLKITTWGSELQYVNIPCTGQVQ